MKTDRSAPEALLTRAQAAEVLGVEVRTLANWAVAGKGPRFIRFSDGKRGAVRYRPSDLAAWVRAREVETEGAA